MVDGEDEVLLAAYRHGEFKPVRNRKATRAEAESAARRHSGDGASYGASGALKFCARNSSVKSWADSGLLK